MKERPILFKGEMVNAILQGRKTQTRRIVKTGGIPDAEFAANLWLSKGKCPYGERRGKLWVRETWADVNSPDGPAIAYRADGCVRTWHEFSETFGPDEGAGPSMDYKAYPGEYCAWYSDLLNGEPGHNWKPSIHMPRWVSRITLDVIDVRVERLQDISEEDAMNEGVPYSELERSRPDPLHKAQFADLWESINGPGSWDANPWVWVVEFQPEPIRTE